VNKESTGLCAISGTIPKLAYGALRAKSEALLLLPYRIGIEHGTLAFLGNLRD
jgi:hypothetical protein